MAGIKRAAGVSLKGKKGLGLRPIGLGLVNNNCLSSIPGLCLKFFAVLFCMIRSCVLLISVSNSSVLFIFKNSS